MGDTIPMWTRASDLRTLTLGSGCEGQWLLSHLYDGELPDAVWFILGTSIHTAIEETILNDLSIEDMVASAHIDKQVMLAEARDNGIIQQTSARAKRGLDTLDTDIERMCDKWWKDVHPSSPDRMDVYANYQWPPVVEHEINIEVEPGHRLITTVDAIFTGINGQVPFGEETLIVDWKTGSTKKAHPSQLQTYAFGLSKEGMFDTESQKVVGMFHHTDHSLGQYVYDYWGDTVVSQHVARTYRNKKQLLESGATFNPDWWCGYCTAKAVCPVEGEGSFKEVAIRVLEAERIEEPTE